MISGGGVRNAFIASLALTGSSLGGGDGDGDGVGNVYVCVVEFDVARVRVAAGGVGRTSRGVCGAGAAGVVSTGAGAT